MAVVQLAKSDAFGMKPASPADAVFRYADSQHQESGENEPYAIAIGPSGRVRARSKAFTADDRD
ncbi:hypothetical protein [Bradyrhizobium sp. STM 3562]|uniref:hypothetical protein n=1 Tax=Bradyrhizobium sp. STM 3562 TaxID=578924 RepID=UPI00389025F8